VRIGLTSLLELKKKGKGKRNFVGEILNKQTTERYQQSTAREEVF